MGCDIHQINIIVDPSTKKAVDISGDVVWDAPYETTYVSELLSGRCYDLFAILAGVRGDFFQITDNVHLGIPEELPADLKEFITERDFHSHTWYYLPDLQRELEWTAEKIQRWCTTTAAREPEFISCGEEQEWLSIRKTLLTWVTALDETKAKLEEAGMADSFKVSKILFFFDS